MRTTSEAITGSGPGSEEQVAIDFDQGGRTSQEVSADAAPTGSVPSARAGGAVYDHGAEADRMAWGIGGGGGLSSNIGGAAGASGTAICKASGTFGTAV